MNLEKGVIDQESDEAKGREVKGGLIKAVDLANRTIEGIASSISLDRLEVSLLFEVLKDLSFFR